MRGRLDRRAEPDGDPRRIDERASLPHRAPRPLDGHRHNRRLRLQSHDKASLLERQQLTGLAARPLGEDQKRVALAKRLCGAVDGGQALLAVRALERDEAGEVERADENGQLAELGLVEHAQPRKERSQRVEDERRFDVARVVDGVHRRAIALDVVGPNDLRRDPRKPDTQPDSAESRPVQDERVPCGQRNRQADRSHHQHVERHGDIRGKRANGGYQRGHTEPDATREQYKERHSSGVLEGPSEVL